MCLITAHHSSHQLIKGLSTQAQRSTGRQRQVGTQVTDSTGHPFQAPSRAVPDEVQPQCPGVKMTHQDDQVPEHLLKTCRGCCLGV